MAHLTAAIAILGIMPIAQSYGFTLAEQPVSCVVPRFSTSVGPQTAGIELHGLQKDERSSTDR